MVITVDNLASVSGKRTGSETHYVHHGASISACKAPQAFGVLRAIL